jgi:hypothetical protein
MTKKTHDLCVKTGTYQAGGVEKARYKTIGALMQGDKGPFIVLDRTFSPAGVPVEDGRDQIIVSCFEPKPKVDDIF